MCLLVIGNRKCGGKDGVAPKDVLRVLDLVKAGEIEWGIANEEI